VFQILCLCYGKGFAVGIVVQLRATVGLGLQHMIGVKQTKCLKFFE